MTILPGQILNPSGAIKAKPISDAIKAILSRKSSDPLDDKTVTHVQEIALALVKKAKEGDVNAIKELADRVEGKAAQSLEVKHVDPFDQLTTSDLLEFSRTLSIRLESIPVEIKAGAGKKKIRAL